jgi:uncharacterized protein (TIGR02118 family)
MRRMDRLSSGCVAFCLFLTLSHALDDADVERLPAHTRIYTPVSAFDPYLDDGRAPPMVLQLYFDRLQELEDWAARLAQLVRSCDAQAMAVRHYRAPDPDIRSPDDKWCTYLVTYEGPAQDEAAWHAHYLAHHPPIMLRLPGLRELEIYARVDWVCPAGWRRVNFMQRNKVAFDSPGALTAALGSPVRAEMRADYAKLPAFSGAVTHYAMRTRVLLS